MICLESNMHKITSIIEIKPYSILVKFDGNNKRRINFSTIIDDFPVLKDKSIFRLANLDDYPTIKWDGLTQIRELDGTLSPSPLDFCPDTLYELSVPV